MLKNTKNIFRKQNGFFSEQMFKVINIIVCVDKTAVCESNKVSCSNTIVESILLIQYRWL